MFKPVTKAFNPAQLEDSALRFWKAERIFSKSRQQRKGGREYVFYEQPPTANLKPSTRHIMAWAFKDLFLRYKTMRGYHVLRRGGWDTHGLPVETEVERQLGIAQKGEIEEYGVERFTTQCRRSVFAYIQEWERLTDRIAFWVDMQDAYVTHTNDYIESLWWILKQFWDDDLLYRGYKVGPYCPRCGTPLSEHEAAQSYREDDQPSVYVRLPLVGEPGTSLLVWTTSPWTLPANVAVAAHPDTEFVTVEHPPPDPSVETDDEVEKLILARDRLEEVFGDQSPPVVDSFTGRRLQGKRYQPLFTFVLPEKTAHYVVSGDQVPTDEGTGLAHIAPAFSHADFQTAVEHDLPVLLTVAEDGTFNDEIVPWRGVFVKDADPRIIQDLDVRGLLFKAETRTHRSPFCRHCDSPLLYYAQDCWYLRTSAYQKKLAALDQEINWYPSRPEGGCYSQWLQDEADWAISRARYWGTPLPVWECLGCHHQICVGSIAELSAQAGMDLTDLDLHRPHLDEVRFPCPECGDQMSRLPDVVDALFDSGAMPAAQWHYPFENQDVFETRFPGDFVCEVFEGAQEWYYALHTLNLPLFELQGFQNAIWLGDILEAGGLRSSASNEETIDIGEILDAHGADALRWYLYTAEPAHKRRHLAPDLVGGVSKEFSQRLWNVYAFFVTHANLARWELNQPVSPEFQEGWEGSEHSEGEILDRWLLAELHTLIRDVTIAYETYHVLKATGPIQNFVDKLSRWYLRRSRRRFRMSALSPDEESAYSTIYTVLVNLSKILAPSMPFLSDTLYQNLVRSVDSQAPESVHLCDWPIFEPGWIDENLIADMDLVMELASLGHTARNNAGLKMSQPLREAAFLSTGEETARVVREYAPLLRRELNVKRVRTLDSPGEALRYSLQPLPGKLGAKYEDRYPLVREAILNLDQEAAAHKLLEGESIEVVVRSKFLEITPEEVEVRTEPKEGLAVTSEGAYLVALSRELTAELVQEGLAREFVRWVLEFRKQAGFEAVDRIHVHYRATPDLARAVEAQRGYITEETRAVRLVAAEPVEDMFVGETQIDGQELRLGLAKIA